MFERRNIFLHARTQVVDLPSQSRRRRAHGSGLVSGQHARLRTQLGQRSFEQIRLLYSPPIPSDRP